MIAICMCNIGTCVHNLYGTCGNDSISIEWKPTRDFQNGERVTYPVCADYNEVDDGLSD